MTTTDPQEMLAGQMNRLYKSWELAANLGTGRQKAVIAQTPRQEIWSLNKTRLYRYVRPDGKPPKYKVPLLLVFALINRPYIFDLRPGNSFVEYMLDQGFDVFLVDWGSPGLEDQNLDFGDYALEYLPRIVRRVQQASGSRDVSLLGWCIGATLVTIYAAQRPDDGLKNAILLTAPLDFSDQDANPFPKWLKESNFDVDAVLARTGNMPGEMIDWGNKMLKPVENFVGTYVRLFDKADEPAVVESWSAMNQWVTDLVPMTGAAFRQWVIDFYRENRLMDGTLMLKGERVDVDQIRASLLNVIATSDHIVPNCQSEPIMARVASKDKQQLAISGGHIGLMAGSGARRKTWPQLAEWLAARSA